MLTGDSLDYFERRIHRLESICLHGGQISSSSGENILKRFQEVESKFNEIQSKVPELQVIIEKLKSIAPILDVKKKSIADTSSKIDALSLQRHEIEAQLASLQAVQSLKHVINKENFADADVLKERLEKIDLLVQSLRPQVDSQMKEIDDLIDIYEQGMIFIRNVCDSWNIRLSSTNEKNSTK